VVAQGSGDAGGTRDSQDGDHQVAQGCHDARAAGGADLRAVFVEVEVTDPAQAVFDPPVAADDGGELGVQAGPVALDDQQVVAPCRCS
jgi:hypothetical protein